MFELKLLSREAIPAALEKVERYRLLNEPQGAESICRDILRTEPENQEALVALVLSLSDQLGKGHGVVVNNIIEVLSGISNEYQRIYYEGITYERQAKATIENGGPGSPHRAYNWFRQAMECYEQAEEIHPSGIEDTSLRWNACARSIMDNNLQPLGDDSPELPLE